MKKAKKFLFNGEVGGHFVTKTHGYRGYEVWGDLNIKFLEIGPLKISPLNQSAIHFLFLYQLIFQFVNTIFKKAFGLSIALDGRGQAIKC